MTLAVAVLLEECVCVATDRMLTSGVALRFPFSTVGEMHVSDRLTGWIRFVGHDNRTRETSSGRTSLGAHPSRWRCIGPVSNWCEDARAG